MNYKINISYTAQSDLDKIYNYINSILQNPIAAENTAIGLQYKILSLVEFPYRGKIQNSKKSNIRFISYKNYLISYEIQEKEKSVIINRIVYRKRNLKEFFILVCSLRSILKMSSI